MDFEEAVETVVCLELAGVCLLKQGQRILLVLWIYELTHLEVSGVNTLKQSQAMSKLCFLCLFR